MNTQTQTFRKSILMAFMMTIGLSACSNQEKQSPETASAENAQQPTPETEKFVVEAPPQSQVDPSFTFENNESDEIDKDNMALDKQPAKDNASDTVIKNDDTEVQSSTSSNVTSSKVNEPNTSKDKPSISGHKSDKLANDAEAKALLLSETSESGESMTANEQALPTPEKDTCYSEQGKEVFCPKEEEKL